MKVEDSIALFLDYIATERRLSALTVRTYHDALMEFHKYLGNNHIELIEEIDSKAVREWQATLMEAGIVPRTVMKKISALKSWHKFLRKQGLAKGDIFAKVSTMKIDKKLPVFYKENEVSKLYNSETFPDTFEGERDKLLLRMLYETGMRRAEIAGLTEHNIDLSAMTIKVLGKRNKQRIIPIENELGQNIERYLALKKEISPDNESLFVTPKGKSLSTAQIYAIVKKYMSALSNADKISPHVFRHTFATGMLNEGANIDAVKELLGHSSLAATEIYTHVTREHLKDAYKHAHPRANGENNK